MTTPTTTELIELPHSGLRVPNTRLHVTSYRALPTPEAEAVTATLRLDENPVGVIQNRGEGRPTWIDYHDTGAFGPDQFDQFVAACQYASGTHVTDQDVMRDLIAEFETRRRLGRAAKDEYTLVRRMEFLHEPGRSAAERLAYQPFPYEELAYPIAFTVDRREQLVDELEARPVSEHGWWELWTGERWERITKPAVPLTAAA
ncbi:hypothetical protein ACIBTV_25450 [Micromonospora sp. NPDC049366]|uniref:hypothetical protein n=1 Tax=Micromonospora sp. NPDC049366 TaxID=3364271 RepID=UPI0037A42AD6